ncbi:MAG: VWA domain-containing protein [Bryobacteraceae bacterium]
MRHLIWAAIAMAGISEAQQLGPPASVGIVFDTSGSMRSKLGAARQFAARFVQANLQDEFCVVKFNDEANLTSVLTTDSGKIQGDFESLVQPRGGSALWDAVYFALNEVEKGRNPRKALLVISDGGNDSSHYTELEIGNAVRDAAVPIYSVGVFELARSRAHPSEEVKGASRLRYVAEQSGGNYFAIESSDDIQVVLAKITEELRAPPPAAR